jgi:hypothetical protein
MSKNVVGPVCPQMTIQVALTRLHAHTPTHPGNPTHREICNAYCFSTAAMVSRTRLGVTLYVTLRVINLDSERENETLRRRIGC